MKPIFPFTQFHSPSFDQSFVGYGFRWQKLASSPQAYIIKMILPLKWNMVKIEPGSHGQISKFLKIRLRAYIGQMSEINLIAQYFHVRVYLLYEFEMFTAI